MVLPKYPRLKVPNTNHGGSRCSTSSKSSAQGVDKEHPDGKTNRTHTSPKHVSGVGSTSALFC